VTRTASTPVVVTLSSNSAGSGFALTSDGPWTSTLDVTVAAGSSDASFYYRDTLAGTATLTAASPGRVSATYAIAVLAPKLSVSSISYMWMTNSSLQRWLAVRFTVVRTSDGLRVPGASVTFTTTRNGVAVASATVQTGADGRATYTTGPVPSTGCYATTVVSLTGAGLAWDGLTPANAFCL
jgi:hypothetical protein